MLLTATLAPAQPRLGWFTLFSSYTRFSQNQTAFGHSNNFLHFIGFQFVRISLEIKGTAGSGFCPVNSLAIVARNHLWGARMKSTMLLAWFSHRDVPYKSRLTRTRHSDQETDGRDAGQQCLYWWSVAHPAPGSTLTRTEASRFTREARTACA